MLLSRHHFRHGSLQAVPLHPSSTAALRSSFSARISYSLVRTHDFPRASSYSNWAGLSKKKAVEVNKVLEELRVVAEEARVAKETAEIKLRIVERDVKLKEEILLNLKELSDFKVQVLKETLEQTMHSLMEKKPRVLVEGRGLSLNKIIAKVTNEFSTKEERSLSLQECWIGIFSRKPKFFQKVKRCNQKWVDEAEVAAAVVHILDKTLGFQHSFHEVNGLIHMDLPEEIDTAENKCLACGVAEEAWCLVGFSTACQVDESDEKDMDQPGA